MSMLYLPLSFSVGSLILSQSWSPVTPDLTLSEAAILPSLVKESRTQTSNNAWLLIYWNENVYNPVHQGIWLKYGAILAADTSILHNNPCFVLLFKCHMWQDFIPIYTYIIMNINKRADGFSHFFYCFIFNLIFEWHNITSCCVLQVSDMQKVLP